MQEGKTLWMSAIILAGKTIYFAFIVNVSLIIRIKIYDFMYFSTQVSFSLSRVYCCIAF